MKHSTVITMVALTLMMGAAAADSRSAQRTVRDPGINQRQHVQRDRIQQGVRSGELTRHETRQLAQGQRDIRQLERAYKSDGVLSGVERRDLHHEQNQASRAIHRQTHDAQDRPGVTVRDPGVNQRQVNQSARIMDGVKSGELTHSEAQGLRAERRDIRELEQGYKSDGVLTRDERVDLHRQLGQQSRDIHAEKRDEESRP